MRDSSSAHRPGCNQPPSVPYLVHGPRWSTRHRNPGVTRVSRGTSFAHVAGAIQGKQSRLENSDKDALVAEAARPADRSWSPDGRATERRRSSTPGHRAVLMSDKSRRIERQFVPAATIRVQSSVGASRCGGTGWGRRPFGGGSRRWMRNASRLLAFPQGPSRSHVRYGFCRRRARMTLLIAASATVVAVLGIILFAVHTTRPRSLRFSASVTRWLTLTLEIDSPQRPTPGGTPKHRRVRGK